MSPIADAGAVIAAALRDVTDGISHCPAPIAGRDAPFNHLLDYRRGLERARREIVRTPRQPA